ncbi:MAG: hypothetical protein ACI9E1_002427, partial [Cryomorphaceae bacterium]
MRLVLCERACRLPKTGVTVLHLDQTEGSKRNRIKKTEMMIRNQINAQLALVVFMLGCLICSVAAEDAKAQKKAGYIRPEINGPVLDPVAAISKMHVAEGFELNLFAAEPQVINPVVMRFDHLGRLWVVEMVGYMNDLKGTKELEKLGRISILEDSTGDGKMDKSKVFLDKLVEPRAIAFHKDGIL